MRYVFVLILASIPASGDEIIQVGIDGTRAYEVKYQIGNTDSSVTTNLMQQAATMTIDNPSPCMDGPDVLATYLSVTMTELFTIFNPNNSEDSATEFAFYTHPDPFAQIDGEDPVIFSTLNGLPRNCEMNGGLYDGLSLRNFAANRSTPISNTPETRTLCSLMGTANGPYDFKLKYTLDPNRLTNYHRTHPTKQWVFGSDYTVCTEVPGLSPPPPQNFAVERAIYKGKHYNVVNPSNQAVGIAILFVAFEEPINFRRWQASEQSIGNRFFCGIQKDGSNEYPKAVVQCTTVELTETE